MDKYDQEIVTAIRKCRTCGVEKLVTTERWMHRKPWFCKADRIEVELLPRTKDEDLTGYVDVRGHFIHDW